jgi:hypothetical protein
MGKRGPGEMETLTENRNVRQRSNEGYRRWFVSSFFDIIVWYDKPNGNLIGFQFCFQKNKSERAFTWTDEYQSSHIVSDGSVGFGTGHMGSAVLHGDGGLIPDTVIERFERESGELDADLRHMIIEKIKIYNSRT